jgi:tetrapyrrole methylase family protein/MazG family protein
MRSSLKRPNLPINKMDSDRLTKAIVSLTNLVFRLRAPGGCPWDAEQTDSSVGMYLIEEAYEVLDAIEKSSPKDVCQELGDLLFHIVFLAQLAEERKEFDFVEVVEKIKEKMIHRHPHVFGNTTVKSAEDVAFNWAKIKRQETGVLNETSALLKDVPMNLPALLGTHRLSERAAKAGFNQMNVRETWDRVQEKFETLRSAVKNEDSDQLSDEMGELLLSLVNLAREHGLNAENILRNSNRRFLTRFEKMEKELRNSGIEPEAATPDQMKHAWKRAKTRAG